MNGQAFAAHLAALVRTPAPEERPAARLLASVVEDWTLLAAHPTPTFVFSGESLRVAGVTVALPAPWREALGGLQGPLRAHGVGGVRLSGAVDRGAVLALLRGARALPAAAPREELQRWITGHGGACVELLPPETTSPDARQPMRALIHAWEACARAPKREVEAALRELVDLAIADPRSLAAILPFSMADSPWNDRRGTLMPLIALVLGTRLRLGRRGLADLVIAGFEAARIPEYPDEALVSRTVGTRLEETLGPGGQMRDDTVPMVPRTEARVAVALWGQRATGDRAVRRHLFARVLALASELESLTRPGGMPPDEALARLSGPVGRRHDPLLVQALVSVLGRFPVGTGLVLETGEVAVVCRPPASPEHVGRPVVRVVVDRNGGVLAGGPLLDLAQADRAHTRVVATVDPRRLELDPAVAVFG